MTVTEDLKKDIERLRLDIRESEECGYDGVTLDRSSLYALTRVIAALELVMAHEVREAKS
jgi:hypothetical protein